MKNYFLKGETLVMEGLVALDGDFVFVIPDRLGGWNVSSKDLWGNARNLYQVLKYEFGGDSSTSIFLAALEKILEKEKIKAIVLLANLEERNPTNFGQRIRFEHVNFDHISKHVLRNTQEKVFESTRGKNVAYSLGYIEAWFEKNF